MDIDKLDGNIGIGLYNYKYSKFSASSHASEIQARARHIV